MGHIDAYRSVDRATAASAQRVAQALQGLYWHELLLRSSRMREHLVPVPEWRTLETMKLISPGVCVEFQPATAFEKPLCGQSQGIGRTPPRWFAAIVPTFLGSHAEVVRPVSPRAATAGTVVATPDQAASISLAWEYILNVIDVALLMAAAIALLASLAIAHTLAPARAIVTALATHGAWSVSHQAAALPLDGAGDDRRRRRCAGRPAGRGHRAARGADAAPDRDPRRRASRARPRAA